MVEPEDPQTSRLMQLFDFSRRENRVAISLALYYMLAMTAFTTLKPARNILLLDSLGRDYFVYGIILTAVVTGVVVWVGQSMSRIYSGLQLSTDWFRYINVGWRKR